MGVTALLNDDFIEQNERLRLALSAAELGTWELDLVHNRRNWSGETRRIHGLSDNDKFDERTDVDDHIIHPEDQPRLRQLHDEIRNGRDDYLLQYRVIWPDGSVHWVSSRGKVLVREVAGPSRIVGVLADITPQKQQQELREYQDVQFRLLADALPQLVWVADAKGNVTYYNRGRKQYFKSNQDTTADADWKPIVHPDDLDRTIAAWTVALEAGQDYEMEHRLCMSNGSFRWHLSRATPARGSSGHIDKWFGTATDIDNVRQAGDRIKSAVDRLKVATDAASMFAWEVDLKTGRFEFAENAADIIGSPREDFETSNTHGDFFVLPEDRPKISKMFEASVAAGKDDFGVDFRGIPFAGKPVFWRAAGRILRDENGDAEHAIGVTQNVTRHIESAAEARLLAERLATAEEGAGALVYDWDTRTNFVWRSSSMKSILGWDPSELPNDPGAWQNLMHPDDLAQSTTLESLQTTDANDRFANEYRIRHKDGRYVWMLDSGRAYRDEQGSIIRIAGTTLDITSRKQLEMSQQRRASLIELSFEPIFVWQPERGIIEWNRGAELLYGYNRDEALGKLPQELLRTRYPVPFDDFVELLHDQLNWSGEIENYTKNGEPVMVDSRYQVIEYDGETMVLESNRDLRERKRADVNMSRMAAVAAASHDALYGTNLVGIIETWNPGAERLLGYSVDEAVGQNISLLAHPSNHEEQRLFLERVRNGETIKPFDTTGRTKDGSIIYVSMAISPVMAADGKIVATSVALHDIGERKEWDQRQRLMNRELAHRVKNSFAILQAIMRSTLKTTPDPVRFAAAFSGRLHSMASAHDVLTANDWRGAELGALLRNQLSHYVTSQRIQLVGDSINLAAENAAPLSLIFNELATNALKYGALSVPRGRINISWRVNQIAKNAKTVTLLWNESDGPLITSVGPRGFGSTLIEKSLADASVVMDFRRDGLLCEITWPIVGEAEAAENIN